MPVLLSRSSRVCRLLAWRRSTVAGAEQAVRAVLAARARDEKSPIADARELPGRFAMTIVQSPRAKPTTAITTDTSQLEGVPNTTDHPVSPPSGSTGAAPSHAAGRLRR